MINTIKNKKIYILSLMMIFFVCFFSVNAAISTEINYQGKLFSSTNQPVVDGSYNIKFRLCSDVDCTVQEWEEIRETENRVEIKNGLFSVSLGSITSLDAVDFDHDLWLGVNVGGSSSIAVYDGEMTPRKKLASVNSSFVSRSLKSDVDQNSISATSNNNLFELTQNGSGDIFRINDVLGDTTPFLVDTDGDISVGGDNINFSNPGVFNFFTPTSAVFGIGGSNNARLRITAGSLDTFNDTLGASIDLHGNLATSNSGVLDLVSGSVANGTNSAIRFWTNNGISQQNSLTVLGNGDVGIGKVNPLFKLGVNGDINFTGNLYKDGITFNNGGKFIDGTNTNDIVYTTGNVGLGVVAPIAKLHIDGGFRMGFVSEAGLSSDLCSGTNSGVERTNSTSNLVEQCNGSDWVVQKEGEEEFKLFYFTLNSENFIRVKSYNFSTNGNVSSAATNSITDNSSLFSVDSLIGKEVLIYDGTGAESRGKIVSNTSTVINISGDFTIIPDSTSKYIVGNRNELLTYKTVEGDILIDTIVNNTRTKTISYDSNNNIESINITY